ncbi:hypothetical protein QBC34DRAFT_499930 [Podospora aff. communis PSN243]|uniref:Uncharacterized protein n=1 Tax=Podospora aff. communis PSN243 TaxID=3040156 RepID=A0AAV9G4M6_9PEZI|nr:hypothetical protein QBC34DRAFT_499930 [Podospora aff. communis PSN243]
MRSHPYTPPPPLPSPLSTLASDLSAILPNQSPPPSLHQQNPTDSASHRRRASSLDLELSPLDPDTSRLLPTRLTKKRHHVRVQGKLVVVRSISSAANLKPIPGGSAPASPLPVGVLAPLVTPGGPASGGEERRESLVGRGRGSPLGRVSRRRSLDDVSAGLGESEGETEEEVREVVVRDRQLRGYGIGGAGNIRRPTDVANFANTDKRRWNLREMLGLTAKTS